MPFKKLFTALLAGLLAGGPAVAREPGSSKAEAVPQQAAEAAYRLQAGDTVDIRIFKHEDLSVRGPVNADGTVALQFIGSVIVAGLTPVQVRARIEALYADGWLKKPQAAVNVVEYARSTITVAGQVNRAHTFTIPRNRRITLLEAIGTAGHFNTRANQRTVLLKRGGRTYEVNVKRILKNPETDVPLRDGDVVWVKEAIF